MSTSGSNPLVTRGTSWLVPAVVVVLTLGLGAWTYGRIELATTRHVEQNLRAAAIADATALECWLDARTIAARALADDAWEHRPGESLDAAARRHGFIAAALVDRDGSIESATERLAGLARLPDVMGAALRGTAPGAARALPPARVGTESLVPFVVAPRMSDGRNEGPARPPLLVAADALHGEFARLFAARRTGVTGESFAFDADGLLLTPTRFQPELVRAGLVDETGAALALSLRAPGADLRAGEASAVDRRALPLTALVAAAPGAPAGALMEPYEGALGRDVVGAWVWNASRGYGVASEIAATEAYASVRLLRWAAAGFAAVLLLAGFISALIAHRNRTLQNRVHRAERRVRQLGQYTLVKKIGEGGMGEVYYARHAMLRRPTAVKLLRPDKTSEDTIARFEREVQQTSRLTHHNTIQIFDFGRTPGGTFYYAMEYLRGIPLDEFVDHEGPLSDGRVIFILAQICASLNEAHGLGLIHRDIKPANVALCQAGGEFDIVKVLDFGLVMNVSPGSSHDITMDGALTGTPHYMAPEAFLRPHTVDARSDIYAVGCVAYYLLTGKTVFEAGSILELLNKPLKEKPVPPSERADRAVQPDLEALVLACLEKEPERRPQTANAVIRELEWCRSYGEWNQAKARYWWRDHAERLERTYGLSAKDPSGSKQATIAIDVRDRLQSP